MTKIGLAVIGVLAFAGPGFADELPELSELCVTSTMDGTRQPSRIWVPPEAASQPTPLLVCLHTWSGDYRQPNDDWQREAVDRNWIYLHPNFRGPNDNPAACGSEAARRDVLDAVRHVTGKYRVDQSRIYLAGSSGGGHMAMLMAGYHPERFSAVSAWVGISDLAEWYRFHTKDGKPVSYARMVAAACGGPPGASPQVDAEYRARSPLFHLHRTGQLPIEFSAGVRDGHSGSVPFQHSLRAYNVVARSAGAPVVTGQEMDQLWSDGKRTDVAAGESIVDESYGRAILLRRATPTARVTIFDGGHEGIARAAAVWLAGHERPTQHPSDSQESQ